MWFRTRGFGSVVKHLAAEGLRVRSPLTLTKITEKGDMYCFFTGKMLPCISALHWAR